MLTEITELKEIAAAQRKLERRMSSELKYKRARKVGYPSGNFDADVRFATSSGTDVTWWSGGLSRNGKEFVNFVGRGDPNSSSMLNIDLQFNTAARKFSRRHGGAFVHDSESGEILLAHRGIVTRGNSRVPRDLLFSEANVTLATAASSVKPGQVEVAVVAPLTAVDLSTELRNFALEMRRAANEVTEDGTTTPVRTQRQSRGTAGNWQRILGDYFDEASGKRTVRGRGAITVNWKHGKIVRALHDAYANRGRCYKSGLLDLAIDTSKAILVFEVKTNAGTQSVYTGIGQLFLHGIVVGRVFPGKRIDRYLVTPTGSLRESHAGLCHELNIKLVSFDETSRGIEFVGL